MEKTVSMEWLWSFIKSLSLNEDNSRWLADRLLESFADTADEKDFGLADSKSALWHGKTVTKEAALKVVESFPIEDKSIQYSEEELMSRLYKSVADYEAGRYNSAEDVDQYFDNLLKSLAS